MIDEMDVVLAMSVPNDTPDKNFNEVTLNSSYATSGANMTAREEAKLREEELDEIPEEMEGRVERNEEVFEGYMNTDIPSAITFHYDHVSYHSPNLLWKLNIQSAKRVLS